MLGRIISLFAKHELNKAYRPVVTIKFRKKLGMVPDVKIIIEASIHDTPGKDGVIRPEIVGIQKELCPLSILRFMASIKPWKCFFDEALENLKMEDVGEL